MVIILVINKHGQSVTPNLQTLILKFYVHFHAAVNTTIQSIEQPFKHY